MTALGFRAYKDSFEVVGQTKIRKKDPQESAMHSGWDIAEAVLEQVKWDGRRKG